VISDKILVEQAQKGDTSALSELIGRHQKKVTNKIFKYTKNWDDAEDAAQDAALNAFRFINNFNGKSSFYTWFFRIGINEASQQLKKFKCRPPRQDMDVDEQINEDLLNHSETPEEMAKLSDLKDMLNDCMDEMFQDYAECLTLREQDGLTYDEIAEKINVPVGTVRSRINRAKKYINEQFEDFDR